MLQFLCDVADIAVGISLHQPRKYFFASYSFLAWESIGNKYLNIGIIETIMIDITNRFYDDCGRSELWH